MTSKTTILVPTKSKRGKRQKKTVEKTGKVAWLMLGNKKHKFFIQEDGLLADYRTGCGLGNLGNIGFLRVGIYAQTQREKAQVRLDHILTANTLGKVKRLMADQPTLNP